MPEILLEDSPLYCHILKEFEKDPLQDLAGLQKKYGLDGATQFLYFRFTKSHRHKVFRQLMADRETDFSNEHQNIDVLIVPPPPSFWSRGDKEVIEGMRQVSLGAGFGKVEVFQNEIHSVLDGALKIKRHLLDSAKRGKKLLIFSFSYGSASVRFAMDQLEPEVMAPVLGWVNLSGLIFGSPQFHCSPKKPKFWNRNAMLLRSYSCEQKYFIQPLSPDAPPMISFLGFQMSHQMSSAGEKLYEQIRHWGPNDGIVPFQDYQKIPGFVVPLWGHGHHIQCAREQRILQKTLCYLVELSYKQSSKNWSLPKMQFEIEDRDEVAKPLEVPLL